MSYSPRDKDAPRSQSQAAGAGPAPTQVESRGARGGGSAGATGGYTTQLKALRPGTQGYARGAERLAPVQAKGDASGARDPQAIAAAGTVGSGGSLPYLDQIQASFGCHDVTAVQAYRGGAAEAASEALGAAAFATGNKVAFGGAPDLHTAAHEAAHVVQQRSGVSLQGGVGRSGDRYERHADAVADAVVAGRSAEGLLSAASPGAGAVGVQLKDGGDTCKTSQENTKDPEKKAFVRMFDNAVYNAAQDWRAVVEKAIEGWSVPAGHEEAPDFLTELIGAVMSNVPQVGPLLGLAFLGHKGEQDAAAKRQQKDVAALKKKISARFASDLTTRLADCEFTTRSKKECDKLWDGGFDRQPHGLQARIVAQVKGTLFGDGVKQVKALMDSAWFTRLAGTKERGEGAYEWGAATIGGQVYVIKRGAVGTMYYMYYMGHEISDAKLQAETVSKAKSAKLYWTASFLKGQRCGAKLKAKL